MHSCCRSFRIVPFNSVIICFSNQLRITFFWDSLPLWLKKIGVIQESSTLLVERLGLTHERPNCHFTGTNYSLRSVSKWRSTNSSGLWYPQRSLLSALTNQSCRNLTMGRDMWKARKSSYTTMQQARVQCYCLMQPLQGKKPFHYQARNDCNTSDSRSGFLTGGLKNDFNPFDNE